MELTIGEHAGFCFGVRRAVLKAFECAEKQLPCVTLGPLIHNPQEVERLRRAGIRSVETLDEVKPGETVIIRSHGVTPDVYRQCEARGIPVIDATCPHVAHIHQLVRQYSEHGDAVVIVGEADHPRAGRAEGFSFCPTRRPPNRRSCRKKRWLSRRRQSGGIVLTRFCRCSGGACPT